MVQHNLLGGVVSWLALCDNGADTGTSHSMSDLSAKIKSLAKNLGFDVVGITSAEPFVRDEEAAVKRVREGLMDGLSWYTEERVRKANRPQVLLEGAKSVVSLALSYNYGEAQPEGDGPHGKIGRYAWGNDYHDVMKKRLREFVAELPIAAGREVNTRIFVDDGPMNDRAAAERAGVGWFGKNTNILTPSHGSWVLLGQVITDLDLTLDEPLKKTCGVVKNGNARVATTRPQTFKGVRSFRHAFPELPKRLRAVLTHKIDDESFRVFDHQSDGTGMLHRDDDRRRVKTGLLDERGQHGRFLLSVCGRQDKTPLGMRASP